MSGYSYRDDFRYAPERYSYRDFQRDTELLYKHLLSLRKSEQPGQLLDRLHYLLIEGRDYPDLEVLAALNRIVLSKWADQEFNLILNRCCYILMNYWWSYLDREAAAVELVELFRAAPFKPATFEATQQLRERVKRFIQSDQYLALRHRINAAEVAPTIDKDDRSQPVRDLIPRYPYLYPHYLTNWDSSDLGQHVVNQLQAKKERQFEQNLHRYSMSALRPTFNSRQGASSTAENPTLLSDQQLQTSIRCFAGKAEGSKTYHELAQQFVVNSHKAHSYRAVKRDMYEYLTAAISPEYGKHHFNHWLEDQLDAMLPQNDALRPNSALLIHTCSQLINSLVANPRQQPNNHGVFVDLTTNLGATFTIGLLLKIILLCREAKLSLETIKLYLSKRFATVLKHYETKVRAETEWLVECLENLMVAFSIHFGQADFTWVKLI